MEHPKIPKGSSNRKVRRLNRKKHRHVWTDDERVLLEEARRTLMRVYDH